MNRGARRPLLALVVASATIGAWFGLSPSLATPAGQVAEAAPSGGAHMREPRAVANDPSASASSRVAASPSLTGTASRIPAASLGPPGPATAPPPRRHGTASATPLLRAALDIRLEALRAKYGIPGISASILFADGSMWRGHAGLADVAIRRAVTDDTAFSVASVSKTFTAALILKLVEDGALSLDTTAKSILPTLAIDPAITVRELLDHTSGLRDFYFNPRIDKALLTDPGRRWDANRSLRYLGKPFAKPGVSWHYSNTNYLILGMIAEAAGKAPVADQLARRFFEPLGLGHTYYQAVDRPTGPVARGYRFTGVAPTLPAIDLSDGTTVVPFTSVVTAAGAAGSIATSSGDLARWARALYGGSALEPDTRSLMVADIVRTAQFKPSIPYGLGVQAVRVAGHLTLGHSGRFLGARAVVRWLPDERLAISVLTNQSRTDPGVVLADLLRLAVAPPTDCITCPAIP